MPPQQQPVKPVYVILIILLLFYSMVHFTKDIAIGSLILAAFFTFLIYMATH